jgi:DNA replication protein DnaC
VASFDELGFAPLDDTGAQLLFRIIARRPRTSRPGNRVPLAVRILGRFLPEHTTTVSMLDRLLHHCHVVVRDGES